MVLRFLTWSNWEHRAANFNKDEEKRLNRASLVFNFEKSDNYKVMPSKNFNKIGVKRPQKKEREDGIQCRSQFKCSLKIIPEMLALQQP